MRGKIMLGLAAIVLVACASRPAGASYLYFSPTAGVWHWDDDAYPDLTFDQHWKLVYGGRAGYAFTQAFSGELVGLTGTNDAALVGIPGPSESLRLTELDLS